MANGKKMRGHDGVLRTVVWSLATDDQLELPVFSHESLVELCRVVGLNYHSTTSRFCRGEPIYYRTRRGQRIRCKLHRIELEDDEE